MPRVYLIHWNASEAEKFALPLRNDGYDVAIESADGSYAGKLINETKPMAILIYLLRSPSHGLATAVALKKMKATHTIPIIFIGGSPENLKKCQEKVPDALFSSPEKIFEVLDRIRNNKKE